MGKTSSFAIIHPLHLHKKRFLALALGMVQLWGGAGPLMWKKQDQPTSAQRKPQMKGIALPGILHTATMTTSGHWSYLTPQSQEMAENLKSTQGHHRLHSGSDSASSSSSGVPPQYQTGAIHLRFPPPKFDIWGGIYITFIFPRHSLQQHSWKYLLSHTPCTVFEPYFPKKLSLHGLFLRFPVCACLSQPFLSKLANGWAALAHKVNLIPTFG